MLTAGIQFDVVLIFYVLECYVRMLEFSNETHKCDAIRGQKYFDIALALQDE